jgi:4-diphosphocytidyl-2-C-methyl-D-erythritol kinase
VTSSRFAPAKLNLTLAVTGRREDGFHALHSVMVPLAFGDEISLSVGSSADSLEIEGADDLQAGPENLVLRAIAATRAAVLATGPSAELPPLAARLTKRIPVAAGLGGGSSDAAATIGAALEAWEVALPGDAVRGVAASLGSDVPFFLAGGAALVTGRGEFVEPLPPLRGEAPAVLIVTPDLPVPTAAVFAAYAAGARPSAAAATFVTSERLAAALRAGSTAADLLAIEPELVKANDLLPAALSVAQSLAGFRDALSSLLGRQIGLSGSGPTSWLLYPSIAEARRAAALVQAHLPEVGRRQPFVAATTTAFAPESTTSRLLLRPGARASQ